jgi:hypothetical protein
MTMTLREFRQQTQAWGGPQGADVAIFSALEQGGIDPRQLARAVSLHPGDGVLARLLRDGLDLWSRSVSLEPPRRLYLHAAKYTSRYDSGRGADVTSVVSRPLSLYDSGRDTREDRKPTWDASLQSRSDDLVVEWRFTADCESTSDAIGIVAAGAVERLSV